MVQQAAPPAVVVTHADGTAQRVEGRAAGIIARVLLRQERINERRQGHLHYTWGSQDDLFKSWFEDYD